MKVFLYLNRTLKDGRLNFFFFLIVIFSLPINRHIFTLTLGLWVLSWFLEGNFKEKFKQTNFSSNIYSIALLSGLYLIMFISLLWSNNRTLGYSQLGTHASLIIFPFFLSFSNNRYRSSKSLRKIFMAFVFGIIITIFYLLSKAFIYSVSFENGILEFDPIINGWKNVFLSSEFSFMIHPSYYGMMILMAAIICFVDIKKKLCLKGHSLLKIIIVILLISIQFLVSSRAMILAASIIAVWFSLSFIKYKKYTVIITGLIIIALPVLLSLHPRFSRLISSVRSANMETLNVIDDRFSIWNSALILISENPLLGVGVGDVKNELVKNSRKNDFPFSSDYNCHNQYLEQWLSGGLFSLIILISALILPLFSKNNNTKEIYIGFLMLISIAFAFESILYRFWGVAFFSIFYTLLTRKYTSNSIASAKNNFLK